MAANLPKKVIDQIAKAGLPTAGEYPFKPKLIKNQRGDDVIERGAVQQGPKKGKRGFVDEQGRIWIKDRAHGTVPDHWDVQEYGGKKYFRVDGNGNQIS